MVLLVLIEFCADKFPAINHINDAIQTFVRPAAGAGVFAVSSGIVTDIHPILALGLGLLISGGVHATKSLAIRPAVTATTAGAGNVPVSILEDIISTVISILSIIIPILIVLAVILFLSLAVWLFWRRSNKMRTA